MMFMKKVKINIVIVKRKIMRGGYDYKPVTAFK